MSIPLEIIKIEDPLRDGYHVLCRIHIAKKEFRMLLDTGASLTVFDLSKANRFSSNELIDNEQTIRALGNDDIESKYLVIDEMRLGDITFKDYKTILVNLSHFNITYKQLGLPLIDGIIGGDILVKHKALIDYNKREMILV